MTTIETTIERYEDKSGKLFAFDVLPDNIDDYKYHTINLKVEGYYSYVPARTNCSIEDSHPDESESEITSAVDDSGKDWTSDLTDDENEAIIELIIDSDDSEEPDYDVYECD